MIKNIINTGYNRKQTITEIIPKNEITTDKISQIHLMNILVM